MGGGRRRRGKGTRDYTGREAGGPRWPRGPIRIGTGGNAVAGPLLDRIRSTAEANPAAPAFIFQDGILTRGQVLALYHGTTRLLRERGIRAGDAVGLSMARWPMHCVALLALARLGAVSIPLAPGLSAAGEGRRSSRASASAPSSPTGTSPGSPCPSREAGHAFRAGERAGAGRRGIRSRRAHAVSRRAHLRDDRGAQGHPAHARHLRGPHRQDAVRVRRVDAAPAAGPAHHRRDGLRDRRARARRHRRLRQDLPRARHREHDPPLRGDALPHGPRQHLPVRRGDSGPRPGIPVAEAPAHRGGDALGEPARDPAHALLAQHLRPLWPHRARRRVARHAGDARGRARERRPHLALGPGGGRGRRRPSAAAGNDGRDPRGDGGHARGLSRRKRRRGKRLQVQAGVVLPGRHRQGVRGGPALHRGPHRRRREHRRAQVLARLRGRPCRGTSRGRQGGGLRAGGWGRGSVARGGDRRGDRHARTARTWTTSCAIAGSGSRARSRSGCSRSPTSPTTTWAR